MIIVVVVLAIYLSFLTKNYYWDGVVFAQTIERAKRLPELFHPNHLVYNVVGYIFYKAAGSYGQAARPLKVLQMANCALSALAALVFFRILRRSLESLYLAGALTLLFAFSATWWKFSTDADAYIPSTLFLLIAFCFLLPGKKSRPFIVALVHVCALLFHELAVFFYPVALIGLLYQDPGSPWRNRIAGVVRYTVVAAILTVGAYVACFYLTFKDVSIGAFLKWITYYTPENGFSLSPWKDLTFTVGGNLKLFFGGRFNLIVPWLSPAIIGLFVLLGLCILAFAIRVLRKPDELRRILRNIPQGLRAIPRAFRVLKMTQRQVPQTARDAGEFAAYQRHLLIVMCTVWCFTYLAFLFFFIPINAFYRLFYFPALIILIGLAIMGLRDSGLRDSGLRDTEPYKPHGRAALAVAIAVLCNFLFLIFPYHHVRPDTPLSLALSMNQVWPAGAQIYYFNMNTDDYLISYVNPSTKWVALNPAKLDRLERNISQIRENGGEVWLETTAIDEIASHPGGEAWLAAHTDSKNQYKLTDHGNDIVLVQATLAAR